MDKLKPCPFCGGEAAFLCAQDNQLNPFWKETPFEDTERGTGGFGSTGR